MPYPLAACRDKNQPPASAEPAWVTALRYYASGDVTPGLFPNQLNGQAEALKVAVVRPESLSMK